MPGIERLSISHLAAEAARDRRARDPGGAAVRHSRRTRTRRRRAPTTTRASSSSRSARIKQAVPELLVITDVCLCEYTSHGHCGVVRADGQVDNDVDARAARQDRDLARGGRRRRRRALRHDGRPRRRDPLAARQRGPQRAADHRLQRQVRLRLLRPVPRGGRVDARVRRPPRLPDGPGQRRARRCARRSSTSRRAPTS